MTALLSLSGVNSVLTTMWSTPFSSQTRFLNIFWQLLSKKQNIVVALAAANLNHCIKNQINMPDYAYQIDSSVEKHSRIGSVGSTSSKASSQKKTKPKVTSRLVRILF
jgi:hypothetical protein